MELFFLHFFIVSFFDFFLPDIDIASCHSQYIKYYKRPTHTTTRTT